MIDTLNYDDALYLAYHMRDVDVREVFATRNSHFRHEFASDAMRTTGWCLRNQSGVPVAMMGYYVAWANVATAWMVATDELNSHILELTRFAKPLVHDKRWHRTQAFSADFHTESHRWLEILGFQRGATLRKYGKNGEDFIVFERV